MKFKHTEKAKEKIRQARLGKKMTEETKQKIALKISVLRLGKKHSSETRMKMSESQKMEKNHNWKNEGLGYGGIHYRIKLLWGKANQCENCRTESSLKYEWANKDHKYSLNRKDWMQLCTSCHRKYDFQMMKGVLQCA